MRLAMLFFFALTLPAFATIGWTSYDNARFGYRGAVPSGFAGYGEDESGVGQIFDRQPSMQVLSYFGEDIKGDFAIAVANLLQNLTQQGWNLEYQAVTPDWASATAVMGKRRVQVRMVLLCDRQSVATMTLQYTAAEAADIRPIAADLETRFLATGC